MYKSIVKNRKWKGEIPNWRDDFKSYQKERLNKIRTIAIDLLGSRCSKCGFSDIRALQIDHIKGGGTKERKIKSFGNHVIKSILDNENKFQLLCANCNWIKKYECDETPHKKLHFIN